jgi:DNA repair protein RadC
MMYPMAMKKNHDMTTAANVDLPQERMRRYGMDALSDAELLAILLRTGTRGQNVMALTRRLLRNFGGLRGLLQTPVAKLQEQDGLGPVKSAQLCAIQALSQRCLRESIRRGATLESPDDTRRYLQSVLRDHRFEVFACLFLDTRHRVIAYEELFHGTIDGATVYPRVVAEKALQCGAAALIVAHNHPSGISEPSLADQAITRRLKDALGLLDIRLLDHFVVGDGDPVSMASRGML